jgi:uncharacterized protein (DUF58 family)
MKKIYFLFLAVCFVNFAMAQKLPAASSPATDEAIYFKEAEFNFGRIPQGKPVTHIFEVVNKSNAPLALENVQASCGCTTPEWNKDIIPPGGSTKITVGYNAAAEGAFEKTISVFYHNGKMKTFTIKGNVWKTPEQSAPVNNSITILKNLN